MAATKKDAESPKKETVKKTASKKTEEPAAEVPKKETVKKAASKKEAADPKPKDEPAIATEVPKKETVKKAAPKKEAADPKPKDEPATATEIPKKETVKKPAPKKQYVVWREEEQKWAVKKEGSEKATRLFRTKAEAEEYAKGLAENQGSRVVRQKKDGKFQKEKY